MVSFEDLATDDNIREEYKKTFLLNIFKKIVTKMKNDATIAKNIRVLYR